MSATGLDHENNANLRRIAVSLDRIAKALERIGDVLNHGAEEDEEG